MTDYRKWERIANALENDDYEEEEKNEKETNADESSIIGHERFKERYEKCQRNVLQMEKKEQEYKALDGLLDELPKKLSHEVMVPLGKKAFCPGQLKRTNEVLVHLGADHYVWQSAFQAKEVCQRQLKAIDTDLKQETECLNELEEKRQHVETIVKMNQNAIDDDETKGSKFIDIREDLNDEEEKSREKKLPMQLDEKDVKEYFDIEEQERLRQEQQSGSIDYESILDKLERLETGQHVTSQTDRLKQDGKAAFAAKEFQRAAELYSQALALKITAGDKAVLFSNRSACMFRLNRYMEALDDASQAIQCDSTYAKAYYRKAMVHKQLEQYEEAAGAFEKAAKLCPADEAASLTKQAQEMKSKTAATTTIRPSAWSSTVFERNNPAPADEKPTESSLKPEAKVSRFKARRLAGYQN